VCEGYIGQFGIFSKYRKLGLTFTSPSFRYRCLRCERSRQMQLVLRLLAVGCSQIRWLCDFLRDARLREHMADKS